VIPLPRAWLLTSALLVGTAVGLIVGIASTLLVDAALRPDVVIALVVGVPGALGVLTILFSGRRWVTAVGAFLLAIAPGWFGVLVAIQAVHGA
jgi:Putative holin